MPLTRIEIIGYRGFKERGVLDFAVPSGKIGSGLTVLTGPNNAGKSSILESLRARSGPDTVSFSTGTRNAGADMVEIKYVVDGKEEVLRSVTKGSSETTREGAISNFDIFVLPLSESF